MLFHTRFLIAMKSLEIGGKMTIAGPSSKKSDRSGGILMQLFNLNVTIPNQL